MLKTGATVTLRTELYAAFADIIEGKVVKRSKHDLMWQSKDATALFLEALESSGYLPTRVGNVPVEPGERVPAFYIAEHTAYDTTCRSTSAGEQSGAFQFANRWSSGTGWHGLSRRPLPEGG